ncbi:SAM-dependent chlorinase/fluorinase [Tenacibaculum finnmarkense]|uniref:SAM hydrolase/SAM-dependent halogenase family protein n=1 Tax=Tenacibaculum finnmarkense TaxID=2781243 RepID=UPI001EFBE631|nr:SAM-dependent chlorinase/fluorinase [Tenacibaculum finnmarkense]MCG8763057.1 SAM-dependent chlorinase/fluorinase [Tenacibaculum finnmarkense]MCG8788314.1 SAM-dependent chlorinase/fluorinase [Tenacibaculum finnmarkense]MCG8859714.1 SAM-dependent chlorinase/fluorinase [Tenacibaculum finnmarkense]
MSLITLTTDFGIKDHFVSAVKGAIYSELPEVKIVDITHHITPFNITETAYILRNTYKSFPDKTIHIIGVDSELSAENKHIAIELDNHYFICPDNGIISMITSDIKPTKIVEINIHNHIETSFPVLDVFVQVASHIARGGSLNVIGKEIDVYKNSVEIKTTVNKQQTIISGGVIYTDNYGNVITNIDKKLFKSVGKGRNFIITAKRYTFTKIYKRYNEIVDYAIPKEKRNNDGEKLAIFNSSGFLEIAIYRSNLNTVGGASTLLGLGYRDSITVEFDAIPSAKFITEN